jgi:hypothetical protein
MSLEPFRLRYYSPPIQDLCGGLTLASSSSLRPHLGRKLERGGIPE